MVEKTAPEFAITKKKADTVSVLLSTEISLSSSVCETWLPSRINYWYWGHDGRPVGIFVLLLLLLLLLLLFW